MFRAHFSKILNVFVLHYSSAFNELGNDN
ncbi:hypothetical protein XAP6164_100002 [Xanthomonas phaseoli pv. phaseoli]|nr:hypothetical protein XAP6164_100002 [Xanthomonas phaseoli pv. phaseoli]